MTLIDERIQKKLFERISQLNRTNINPLEPLKEGKNIQLNELMKTCWVRVISAVPTQIKENNSYKTDFLRLSSAFDYSDGNYTPKNKPLTSKSGFGENIKNTFRPHSGVTGITTEFQNHSIQSVTIDWKVYDMDEFKKYQNAFLKHGRTVLVEFGWGSYDTLGKIKVNNVDSMLEYFENIQEKIFDMNGDYYASCGVVNGFTWNVVEGGGFECQTTLTTMGNTMFKSQIEPYIGGEFPDVSSQAKSVSVKEAYKKANFTFLSQMKMLNEWIGMQHDEDAFNAWARRESIKAEAKTRDAIEEATFKANMALQLSTGSPTAAFGGLAGAWINSKLVGDFHRGKLTKEEEARLKKEEEAARKSIPFNPLR